MDQGSGARNSCRTAALKGRYYCLYQQQEELLYRQKSIYQLMPAGATSMTTNNGAGLNHSSVTPAQDKRPCLPNNPEVGTIAARTNRFDQLPPTISHLVTLGIDGGPLL